MIAPIVLSALIASGQVSAPTQPATPAPAASATASVHAGKGRPVVNGDQVICHQEEVVGSRLGGRKVCMTRNQWREQANESSRDLEAFSRRNAGSRE